jgi:hypothetical protein
MSSTTFISGTLIESSWLNDVNTVTYRINTGTGSTVLATSPTIVSPTITSPTVTDLTVSGTDAVLLPIGTTAQRPTGSAGKIRFNSTTTKFEGYNGTTWASVGGGATGGGSDQVFIENGQTVTTDYTISTSYNAGTFGPVSINSGVTVTVPTGSVWSVI